MARNYLLAVSPSGHSMVLGLCSRTIQECIKTINWMRVAKFNMNYVIVTYSPELRVFIDKHGTHYRPGSAPYTAKAWTEFVLTLRNNDNG